MDRLIAANSVPFSGRDLAPGSGTPQYATSGNPTSGIPATVWPAYAFNAMQDELLAVIVAAGITPDKNNWAQLLAALNTLYGTLNVSIQSFNSSATYTPHAKLIFAIIEAVGPGGGSGTSPASGNGNGAGGGGGYGAYIKALLTAAQIGASQSITIGAPGIAGSTSNGGDGGTTSVGSLLSLPGGRGGQESLTGGGGFYNGGFGGLGGVPVLSTGTPILLLTGQPGGNGNENQLVVSGIGGSGPLGLGGPPAVARAGFNTVDGIQGTGYGSGASGAANSTTGAPGCPSRVIITEFHN